MDSRSHIFEFDAYPHTAFAAPAPTSPASTVYRASRTKILELKQWEENGGQLVTMTENQVESTSDDHGSPQLTNSFKLLEKRCKKDDELRSSTLTWSSERRCQVEGCNSALVGAKDYHKKHKVCESHSKAPKVVVKGIEQRFCQQCSRFHAVSEFDGAKRSCRRKLAWHNKRRRKSVFGTSVTIPSSSQIGRALSLLSPTSNSNTLFSSSLVDMLPIPNTDIREQTSEKQAPLYSTEPYLLSQKIRSWPHANGIGNDDVGNQLINQTFLQGAQYLPCTNVGSWDLMQEPDTFDLSCD